MPYPVLPPEPPLVVNHLLPDQVAQLVETAALNFLESQIPPATISNSGSPSAALPVNENNTFIPHHNSSVNSSTHLGPAMVIGGSIIDGVIPESTPSVIWSVASQAEMTPLSDINAGATLPRNEVHPAIASIPVHSALGTQSQQPEISPVVSAADTRAEFPLLFQTDSEKKYPEIAWNIAPNSNLFPLENSNFTEIPSTIIPAPTPQNPQLISPRILLPSGQTPTQPVTPTIVTAIEVSADRQEYDQDRQVFTAEGNAVMRFRGTVLTADRLQVNLRDRLAVATGNAILTSGEQVLTGDRFEYNFIQQDGLVLLAKGEIYFPTTSTDFSPTLPTDISPVVLQQQALSERLLIGQPPRRVTSPGGVSIDIGSGGFPQPGGNLNRVRFEAEQMQFTPNGWEATNIRITNDPFSPPEVEVRADSATFTRLSPLRDEVRARRPRLVFDQRVSLPILRRRVIIDRSERDPSLIQIGYDRDERGGLFVQSTLEATPVPGVRLRVTPQFFVQRAVEESNFNIFDPNLFGVKARLSSAITPSTSIQASTVLTSLDFTELEDNLRANVRLRQQIGTHTLTGEYSFRDRIFNGSLGYQTVHSSIGAILTSPAIQLGDTGIYLSYQASAQHITADTDRIDLLDPLPENFRVTLDRFQAGASLSKAFLLWQGEGLPATPTEGLRYTPQPTIPFIQLIAGVTGVISSYSSDDNQNAVTGVIGLQGQFGHFSRPWLDYTGFNLTYAQVFQNGSSPFLFDRVIDARVLGAGFTQQIYGPFRLGVQTTINLDTGEQISTDYILEYSRRSYGVTLRVNPEREVGSLTLRISDFNWRGGTEPFSPDSEIRTVEGGVRRTTD